MIDIQNKASLEKLRIANELVARTLDFISLKAKPGVSLKELDALGEDFIRSKGALPSFKGLYGFKGALCLSLNEVCIHGIPDESVLKEGDILGIDIGTYKDGFYGDAARTIAIGEISKEDKALIACSKDALYHAISCIKPGLRFKELSLILQNFIEDRGYIPLLGYCGHGIGKKPHSAPEIPNYLEAGVSPKAGPKIKNGMVFCLEPMICQKSGEAINLKDGWNTASIDGLNTAHYEHCIAVIDTKAVILSK